MATSIESAQIASRKVSAPRTTPHKSSKSSKAFSAISQVQSLPSTLVSNQQQSQAILNVFNQQSGKSTVDKGSSSIVAAAINSISKNLEEKGVFNDVTHAELRHINNTLKKLSPNQTSEVISKLSNKQVTKWASEIDSNGLLGMGGLNKNERSNLFNNLASDLTVKQLARVHNAFDDKSIRAEMVAAVSNKMQASAVSSALQQRMNSIPNGKNRINLESEKQQLNKLQNAKQMARLSADSYRSFVQSNPVSLPAGITRLDPNNLPLGLGLEKEDLMHKDSGFYAAVYQANKGNYMQYIVAFRGTEDGTDWKTNAKSVVMMTKQSRMASEVIKLITEEKGSNNVRVTGHSLGGGLSNHVAVKYDIPSTTFNAKGSTIPELLDTGDILGLKAARLTQNYQVKAEILTGLQESVPVMFQAAGPKLKIPAIRPDGEKGNMLTEVVTEIALSSIPLVGPTLAKQHDISGPIDRHGMDYVERGMASALNIAKTESINHLFRSFD